MPGKHGCLTDKRVLLLLHALAVSLKFFLVTDAQVVLLCILGLLSHVVEIHRDPRMVERFFCTDALVWVFSYHFDDQVTGLVRYPVPEVAAELKFALLVLFQYHVLILAFEKRSAGQNHIENDSRAEYVRRAVVALISQ